MLQGIFLGNCGCCLTDGETSVLIDAPNRLHTVFDPVSDEIFNAILQKQPPYDRLRAVLFSHRHSDHYDKRRLRMLQEVFSNLTVFSPSGATAENGVMTVGDFRVEYSAIAHSGSEFADVPHVSFWVSAAGKNVYFSGDALWDKQAHLDVWRGRTPDVGIWNPNFINHPDGRELMQTCKKNILCHLPIHSDDVLGIGRKAKSSVEKYGSEIPSLRCITEYPMTLEL